MTLPVASALWLVAVATPSTRFDWRLEAGAEACSDGRGVAGRVEERLGRAVFTEGEADEVLSVTLSRAEGQWVADVALRDQSGALLGERRVQTAKPSCEDLETAVVLVISLTLTPHVRVTEAPTPPDPARRPAIPAVRSPAEPDAPGVPWRVAARASLALGVGVLPSVSAGARVSVMLQAGEGWQLELAVLGWLPEWLPGGSGRVRLAPFEVALALCPFNAGGPRVRAAGCAEAAAGVLAAQGLGYEQVFFKLYPLVSLGPSARLELALTERLRLRGGLAALVRPYQPEVTYLDGSGVRQVITRLAPVSLAADLGLALSFQ